MPHGELPLMPQHKRYMCRGHIFVDRVECQGIFCSMCGMAIILFMAVLHVPPAYFSSCCLPRAVTCAAWRATPDAGT